MDYYKLLIYAIYNMYKTSIREIFSLFRMGLFGAAHGWRTQKDFSPKSLTHTFYNDETWQFYLSEEDPKEHINQVTSSLSFPEISISSPEFSNLVISKNTNINCILTHSL